MTKTANIKKSSAALFQNQKQIKRAYDPKQEVTFAAVEKCLGSAQFQLRLTGNKSAKGTPRGLFTSGTMRVSAGQIVLVEGNAKIGLEIVARFDDLAQAQELVKLGRMPADILIAAGASGAVATVVAEDDLFDYTGAESSEGFEPSAKGGTKGARAQRDAHAAIQARVEQLSGGGKTQVAVDDEEAPEVDIDAI
jgi:translation initiation factor IF-1